MSASDDNIVMQDQRKNISKKRLIKARKFYGDTSSNDGIYKRFTLLGYNIHNEYSTSYA